jgi:transcriptional regulator with XRE-family HTH domain
MPVSPVPPVGERIREERARRGLSLRGLARAVGVSPSLISQIETGRSRPSVSTLYGITRALGITLEDVFDPGIDAMASMRSASVPPESTDTDGRVTTTAAPPCPVVRPGDREVLELDSGVTWERLGRVQGVHADFLLVTYAPGGSSSSSGQLMRHAGVEFGYICEGELVLTLGFDEYTLGQGDAVSFPSSTPHRYRNDETRPAVGVWFQPEI